MTAKTKTKAKTTAKKTAPAKAKSPAKKAAPKKAVKSPAPKKAAPKAKAVKKLAPKPAAKKAPTAKVVKKAEVMAAPKPVAKPAPKPAAVAKAPVRPKKAASRKLPFSINDFVVYPTHGVGKITGVEEQEISGHKLKLFVIDFAQDKMTLRVPLGKAETSGMRRLSNPREMENALTTLKGKARVKRAMWSRRAQEYEAKINSGDPISIAEVVRDLHRSSNQPDQSYSERQIYEAALGRLARELAAVEKTDEDSAMEKLEGVLKAA